MSYNFGFEDDSEVEVNESSKEVKKSFTWSVKGFF